MKNLPRPVPGSQPDPGESVPPPSPSGVACPAAIAAVPVRRRALLQSFPSSGTCDSDENTFLELRRKVQSGELLSASVEKLLWKMKFNGHLTVLIQRGRVLKSGYEEGYFRRKNDLGGLLPGS